MFCTKCGKENPDNATHCAQCGTELHSAAGYPQQEDVGPPKTSGMAIASLILGILGLCTCITAPVGLVLGIVSLNQINASRGRLAGSGLAIAGIVVSVGTLLLSPFILLAVLFPVFSSARETARASVCQTNMKELGMAVQMYSRDYNDMLPSSILYGGSKTWNSSDFTSFASVRGSLPPGAASGVARQTWPMVLYRYVGNKDITRCPSDTEAEVRADSRVSYYWKAAVDRAWYGDGGKGFRSIHDFAFPDRQMIFYERSGWHPGRKTSGLTDGVKINCCFLDGRVSRRTIVSSGYTAAEIPAEPLPRSGVGEPAWFNCDLTAPQPVPYLPPAMLWNPQRYGDNLP